ncbi:MAG: YihY/virulence factor BrkB family protein [Actinomycetota bacterium]|nr:YihY/virulence factor BrkB family protein [Actinomycetota bacterium]
MASRRDLKTRVRAFVDIWVDCFAKHDLLTYASAIAFQVLKALVPLTLFGVAALGVAGRRDVWERDLAPSIRPRLDQPLFHAIDYVVEKIFSHNSVPLVLFAAVLTAWYVSGAVRAVMGGLNRIYETKEDRPLKLRWPLSLGLAVCVVAGLAGAALLVVAVPRPAGAVRYAVDVFRWIGAVAALSLAAGLLLRLGPVARRPKRWVTVGATLIILTWVVTSIVFRWYVGSIANFKTAVGQLTVFLVLAVYVYASSIVFLVGAQLDELLRADASSGERGILDLVFGRGRS